MSSLRTQTLTDAEFEALIAKLPNPVVTADSTHKFVTVGVREYRALLQTRGDL